ncbi:MAG TPA: GatB/YqeY domain-containing protein [Pseudogracilibacillus sp.]|nr:GatB/YqeY domain-containing protein [Pseudogracilibacillus sp.]
MSLIERLNEDMKQAMKAKEKLKLSVIRMIKASLQNERIQLGVHELSEDEELTILSREMKQRTDSIKEFQEAGREDLTKKLEDEIKILQAYMPEQLSDEELAEIVKTTISEVNATSKKDFGKVMGQVMPKVKGKTDGSKVQKLVQEYLS